MSTIVMSACWPLTMPPTAKAVLISLADNANDHGDCWPSIEYIATRTCLTGRSVQRAIGRLEADGYLTVDRSNGRHNRYSIRSNQRQSVTPDTKSPVTESRKPTTHSRKPTTQSPPNRKNHQEPSLKALSKTMDFSSWPTPPSAEVLTDWIEHRKRKKAPISPTVLKALGRELHKAAELGFDVDTCLATAMQRNWQGLTASWLETSKPNGATHVRPAQLTRPQRLAAEIERIQRVEESERQQLSAGRAIGSDDVQVLGVDDGQLRGEVVRVIG